MHHVHRRTLDAFGETDDPVERQILRQRGMRRGQILEAGAVLARQLLVHVHDKIVVLGMDAGQPAGLGDRLNHLPDVAERHHARHARRGDVGGEHLDRGIARLHRLGDLAELALADRVEQHQVQTVIAVAGAVPILEPQLDRLADRLRLGHRHEVDERRGAAEQRRPADLRGGGADRRFRLIGHGHRHAAVDVRLGAVELGFDCLRSYLFGLPVTERTDFDRA